MARNLDALAPWYGCKRQIADRIVAALGPHNAYYDLFAASMAVPLAKPPSRMTVVNDLHGGIINLARAVADERRAERLFERLSRTAFCEAIYRDSVAWLEAHPDPDEDQAGHAYHYFLASWQGRNGLAGTAREHDTGFCKRYTANGGDPAIRFRNAVERIPAWWEKMRTWTILNEDAFALVARIPDADGTAVYVDPPYFDKSLRYRHDMDAPAHVALAEALRRFRKARVVLSYYDDPKLDALYLAHGWKKEPVKVKKNLSVTGADINAPEVLLLSPAA